MCTQRGDNDKSEVIVFGHPDSISPVTDHLVPASINPPFFVTLDRDLKFKLSCERKLFPLRTTAQLKHDMSFKDVNLFSLPYPVELMLIPSLMGLNTGASSAGPTRSSSAPNLHQTQGTHLD